MKSSVLVKMVVIVLLAGLFAGNGIYAFRLRGRCQELEEKQSGTEQKVKELEDKQSEAEKELHKNDIIVVGYMYLYKIGRYRNDHGSYPATLQDLVPTYISQRYVDDYQQYWSYVPDTNEDTFELTEIVEDGDEIQCVYSPEFYGIYNKACVEYTLKKRAQEEQQEDQPPVEDGPCEPLD